MLRVGEFGGTFQLDPRSHLFQRVVLDGHYELEVAALCRRLADPARDAVDVGANAGFFSVLLAGHLADGRVLAVEPSETMASRLRANLQRNGVRDRVVVFEGAASDRTGTADLTGIEGMEEYGTIGALAHPAVQDETKRRVHTVATRTLDDLVAAHGLRPGFVKVDVEGAEPLVFRGAESILREHRPVVLSELNDRLLRANGSSAREVLRLFEAVGYRVLDPFAPGMPVARIDDLETPHLLEEVLCLPAEHALAG